MRRQVIHQARRTCSAPGCTRSSLKIRHICRARQSSSGAPGARAQAEAGQVQPARLVVGRALALLLQLEGGVEQRPRGGDAATRCGRRAQHLLQQLQHARQGVVGRAGAGSKARARAARGPAASRGSVGRGDVRALGLVAASASGSCRAAGAHVEGQPPGAGGRRGGRRWPGFGAPDLQRAELGHPHLQLHGHLGAAGRAQHGHDGRQLDQIDAVVGAAGADRRWLDGRLPSGTQLSARGVAAGGGGEQLEADRAVGDQLEVARQRHRRPFLQPARSQADRALAAGVAAGPRPT